ncbi:fasciclin domain-containing protein [Pareuzebyella sediminis]|uniref:fasciclin domain-containing protein n=1 Tax=Pareuzebyella sediminis TaxID=2607998 RepID=UPI0011EC085C|nr:fasciclin domain-containing protein [Pareuzebyella sediminis]
MKKKYASKSKAFGLGLCSALLFFTSCEKSEVKETPAPITGKMVEEVDQTDLYGLISQREDATGFKTLLDYASPEVQALFSGDTEYTVFVPTDAAWDTFFLNYLNYNSISDLTIDKRKDLVDLILSYSMVSGTIPASSLENGQVLESLAEQPFTIYKYNEDPIRIEDNLVTEFNDGDESAKIIESDVEATNGIVHMLDRLILPKGFIQTLARLIIERDDTTIFEEALRKLDLLEFYRDVTRAHAFVPNDATWHTYFNLLGDDYNSIDDFDTEEELAILREIIEEHLTKKIGSDGFSAFSELEGDTQLVMRDYFENGPFGLKDATGLITQFTELDISAENRSYLYIIDRVLLPKVAVDFFLEHYKNSVLDFIMNIEDLEHISEDITCALTDGLPSFLTDGTPFTLFLPNKEALKELSDTYGDLDTQEDREILANIIAYHLFLNEKLEMADIEFGKSYRTFQNETISFETDGSDITILNAKGEANANVVSEDHNISGGTIHIIDGLLIPNELSFYE